MVQTGSHLIAVDEIKGTSIVMLINYTEEFVIPPAMNQVIKLHLIELADIFRPSGWFAKKNFITP